MGTNTGSKLNGGHGHSDKGSGQQPPQSRDERVWTKEELASIHAAMMEELGIGRKDTLPLADSGPDVLHLQQALPRLVRPLARNKNQELATAAAAAAAAAWNNTTFEDFNPEDEKLDNIGDGQLYRQRKMASTASTARQAHFSGRGSPNVNQRSSSGRGAILINQNQSSPSRGGGNQPRHTRCGVSKRGGHSSSSIRGSSNNRGNSDRSGFSPYRASDHRQYFNDARMYENQRQSLSNHPQPRAKVAVESIQKVVQNYKDHNNKKEAGRQFSSAGKSKRGGRLASRPPPKFDPESIVQHEKSTGLIGGKSMARSGEPPRLTNGLESSRFANPEPLSRSTADACALALATTGSFGEPTEEGLKETRVKFRKQSQPSFVEIWGALKLFKSQNVETMSLEISSNEGCGFNDVLYADSGFLVETLPVVIYRPAGNNSEPWIIEFRQPWIADNILSRIQKYQASAPVAPIKAAVVNFTSDTQSSETVQKIEPSAAAGAIHQFGECSQSPTGFIANPEQSFAVSAEDEDWLSECFGNATKKKIMELHTKVLSWPNVEPDRFGSVLSGTLPSQDMRTEIHQSIGRIFERRLDTKFDPGNQKIQIRAVYRAPPTAPVVNHSGFNNKLTEEVLSNMGEVTGTNKLISFSDTGDDVQPVERSEYLNDLHDILPDWEASGWAPQDQNATQVAKYNMEELICMKGGAIGFSPEKLNSDVAHLYRPLKTEDAEPAAQQPPQAPPALQGPGTPGLWHQSVTGKALRHKPTNSDCEGLVKEFGSLKLGSQSPPELAIDMTAVDSQPTPAADAMVEKIVLSLTIPACLPSPQLLIAQQRLQTLSDIDTVANSAGAGQDPTPENHTSAVDEQSILGVATGETQCVENNDSGVLALEGTQSSKPSIETPEEKVSASIISDNGGLAASRCADTPSSEASVEPTEEIPIFSDNDGLATSMWANASDEPLRRPHPGRFSTNNMRTMPYIPRDDPAFQPTYYENRPVFVKKAETGRYFETMAMVPMVGVAPMTTTSARQENISPFRSTPTASFLAPENVDQRRMTGSFFDSDSPAVSTIKHRGRAQVVESPTRRAPLSPVRQGDNVEAKLNLRLRTSLAERGSFAGP